MESILTFDSLLFTVVVKVLVIVAFFLVAALVVGYLEHKVMGHMQDRTGPMEAGLGPVKHGVGQLVADGAKFIQKEDIIPRSADRWVFAIAPGVALVPTLMILVVIPFGPGVWAENLDLGLFFALAASGVTVIGVLMAGWASANKFSLMGAIRDAAQLIAYELPLVLAGAAVALQAGTLSLVEIVERQNELVLFDTIPVWYGVPQVIGFGLFFVAAMAELNRPPFDMPIADSEIIAGHMTEYTGLRYAFFMLSEYAGMVVLSALAVVLFLGGWYPWPGADLPDGAWGAVIGTVTTIAKTVILAMVMTWARATLPRLREDQLQRMAWTILIPLALAQIVVIAIVIVVLP